MHVLGVLIIFAGLGALLLGFVVLCYPLPRLGFDRRLHGLLLGFAGLALWALAGQIDPVIKAQAAADAAAKVAAAKSAPAQPPKLTWNQKLANIRIGGFSWSKEGFGSVMEATFVIYNDNSFPIKDVEVTCVHEANSGTVIDRNTRTIYDLIDRRSYLSVQKFNMGFVHSQAQRSSCKATNFAEG